MVDGIEVEHRLRGVLVGSVSGVDDGHGSNLAGIARCAFEIVAHDDDVCIVRHHHDCVLQGLTFCAAGHFGVGKTDDAGAEAVGGRLERQTGARGGLKEERSHHLAL